MREDDAVGKAFLKAIVDELRRNKERAEKAMAQVPDDIGLHWAPDGESNSIAVLIRHLSGNMRSRWTDFLTTDGEKATRKRDDEFEPAPALGREALLQEWEQGWTCLFAALEALAPADLLRTVTIRSKPLAAMEAIVQAATHLAGHVGQILYLAKQLAGPRWQTLTIPRARPLRS